MIRKQQWNKMNWCNSFVDYKSLFWLALDPSWLNMTLLLHKDLILNSLCSLSNLQFFDALFTSIHLYAYSLTHSHFTFTTWLYIYINHIVKLAQIQLTITINTLVGFNTSLHKILQSRLKWRNSSFEDWLSEAFDTWNPFSYLALSCIQ